MKNAAFFSEDMTLNSAKTIVLKFIAAFRKMCLNYCAA